MWKFLNPDQFFFVKNRHISGKIVAKIRLVRFYVKLLTDKKTDKRKSYTNAHDFLGGSINHLKKTLKIYKERSTC